MKSDTSPRKEEGTWAQLGRLVDRTAKLFLSFSILDAPAHLWLANSRFAWSFVSRTVVSAPIVSDGVKTGEIPQHVSIIMDGNRRSFR